MKRQRVKRAELDALAANIGAEVQHDCGGFRVTMQGRALFPDSGVCSTAPARECFAWLSGYARARRDLSK